MPSPHRGRRTVATPRRRRPAAHRGNGAVVVTGDDLTVAAVVRVARQDARVVLDTAALARMAEARAVVERALGRGESVYGMNTGVAARKRVRVGVSEIEDY